MAERIIERKASNTAAFTCVSRACANREPDIRFRGPDDMAQIFLPRAASVLIAVPALRNLFVRRLAPPGIYEYVLARTKLLDEVFVQALTSGFRQIVLLGAGFDTRALRFAAQNRGTTVFEMDVPTTQQAKIDILRRKGVPLAGELVFVPIDFNKQSLAAALAQAGYRDGQRDLFLWEGVTMYLTPQAVDDTLAFVRNTAAPGSWLAFDYLYASVLRREGRYYGEKQIYNTVSRAGEAWTFGLEEGELEDFLRERGFKLLAHYTPTELEQRYLVAAEGPEYRRPEYFEGSEGDGARFGRINGTHCIALAGHAGHEAGSPLVLHADAGEHRSKGDKLASPVRATHASPLPADTLQTLFERDLAMQHLVHLALLGRVVQDADLAVG
jgi:methyltransferase (TIGR00027 family)